MVSMTSDGKTCSDVYGGPEGPDGSQQGIMGVVSDR